MSSKITVTARTNEYLPSINEFIYKTFGVNLTTEQKRNALHLYMRRYNVSKIQIDYL